MAPPPFRASIHRPLTVVLALLALSACKPVDEPDRRVSLQSLPGTSPAGRVIENLDAWLHGKDVLEPQNTEQDAGPGSPKDALVGGEDPASIKAAQEALDEAQPLIASGKPEEAVPWLEKAIDARPAWAIPRFQLAAAYAVLKRIPQALQELERLVALADDKADHYLRKARVTRQFDILHGEERFRQATRFVPVEISPARGLKNTELLNELVKGLRSRFIPATAGKPWRGKEVATTIYYARRDTIAEEAALEVVRVAALPPRVAGSKFLTSKRPVVLVLVESDTASAAAFLTSKRLNDFFGLPLRAKSEASGDTHRFTLEKTGFFTWTTTLSTGETEERTGRFHVASNRLSLSFRLVRKDEAGSVLRTLQGRRSSHRLQLRDNGFLLDELRLTTQDP